MQRKSFDKMACPIARSLERVGEWWSILIIRDALHGFTRFDEFQKSPSYVLARSSQAFQEVYDNSLATLPGVQRLSSTLVMKSVVENRPLPLYQNRRHQRGPACGTGDRATASRTVAFEEHVAVHAANEASTRLLKPEQSLPDATIDSVAAQRVRGCAGQSVAG